MAFSDETKEQAFSKAGGKCEASGCGKQLVYKNNGRDVGKGSWEAHHRTSVASGGSDTVSNCKVLCWDCHKKTLGA